MWGWGGGGIENIQLPVQCNMHNLSSGVSKVLKREGQTCSMVTTTVTRVRRIFNIVFSFHFILSLFYMSINCHNEICTTHLHKHSEELGKGRQCMRVSDFRTAIESVNTLPAGECLRITRPVGGGGR